MFSILTVFALVTRALSSPKRRENVMTANCLLVLATLTAAVAAVTPISLQQLQPFTDGEPTPEGWCVRESCPK